jgi:hypothetical protein
VSADVVIDATTGTKRSTIALGGEAGNTHYDSVSHCILVAVQTRNQMVAIDAVTEKVARYDLPGSAEPHGFTLDEERRRLFMSSPRMFSRCAGFWMAHGRIFTLGVHIGRRRVAALGADVLGLPAIATDESLIGKAVRRRRCLSDVELGLHHGSSCTMASPGVASIVSPAERGVCDQGNHRLTK